jgi:hypothetical protein
MAAIVFPRRPLFQWKAISMPSNNIAFYVNLV